jgi:hypothetical protein
MTIRERARRSRVSFQVGGLILIAVLLMQAAWVLAVPPYRGIDEFDHVYRASGVAHGQWRLDESAVNARGREVAIPRGLVEAASGQCSALRYTEPGNCAPIDALPGGLVTVGTAAGAYHPLFYAMIGIPTRSFDGDGAVYAMRAVAALVCAVGIAIAGVGLRAAGAGRWTGFALVLSLTPVFIYSTTLPAPNGIEMVAGLCLWSSLLALLNLPDRRRRQMWLGVATVAACCLATVRSLGPIWLLLTLLVVLAYAGRRRWWQTVRSLPEGFAASGVAVMISLVLAAWWQGTSGPTQFSEDLGDVDDIPGGLSVWLGRVLVWALQVVGAFPLRDDVAPIGVYAIYSVFAVVIVSLAMRRLVTRERILVLGLCVSFVLLPVAITAATYDVAGVIWQGRYGLPLFVGFPLIVGMMLDRCRDVARLGPALRRIGVSLIVVCHAWCVAHVLLQERGRAVSMADQAWPNPPVPVVVALAGVGALVLVIATHFMTSAALSEGEHVTSGSLVEA